MKSLQIVGVLLLISFSGFGQTLLTDPTEISPILIGEEMPDATLYNLEDEPITVRELVKSKPTLFIIYRGSWCPYCNKQLAGLQMAEEAIRNLGFQIVAISPDTPTDMRETIDNNELTYQVYSDKTTEFITQMGLVFKDKKGRVLPVPAIYMVDTDGLVQFSYVNSNYKVRPEPELILKAAELMKEEK
ncbi:MAG: AhpC/TSA family protein [Cyclobacteriaceae bacterium]